MGYMTMFYYLNANRLFFKKYEKGQIQKDLPKFRLWVLETALLGLESRFEMPTFPSLLCSDAN